MYLMYVSYNYLIYQLILMRFFIYFIAYSSYSKFIAAHGVDIHAWARDQPVGAGTPRLIIIGFYSL